MLVGVDLGGTAIKAGIVSADGKILFQSSRPTNAERDYTTIIQDIIEQVEKLAEDNGVNIEDISSIGIGVPGLVDYTARKVVYCANLHWNNIPLGEELERHFAKPVYVENDATAAAYGESLFGATRGFGSSVFLTLGTGIGAGIIMDGSIYRGSHNAGGEIGHMIVGENFYDCNCGKNGCLETFASATALIKYMAHMAKKDELMGDGIPETVNARAVFNAAREGDAMAQQAVERLVKYLSIGIVNIYNLLDPDIIAIGGGVSKAGEYLLDMVRAQVFKLSFSDKVQYGDIVLAELGNNGGIIGAAFLGK